MNTKEQFLADLAYGEQYESKYIKIKKFEDGKYKKMQGNFKYYDFEIYDTIDYTVEIKTDRISHYTHNICIEYECNDKPSGIDATTADIFVYIIVKPNSKLDVYEIPVFELKDLIKQYKYLKVVECDNNKNYLFKDIELKKFLTYKDINDIY